MRKKKIDCIFYLVDEYLYMYVFKTEKIMKYRLLNYIAEGRIIKPKKFIHELISILKEEKINKVLTNLNTIIIYNPNLKYIDKKIIIDSFSECNFNNIKMINSKELINKNKYLLEINMSSIIYYYDNKYIYFKINNIINIKLIIKLLLKDNTNNIVLIGINPSVESLVSISNNLYYLENSETYYIDTIIKRLRN